MAVAISGIWLLWPQSQTPIRVAALYPAGTPQAHADTALVNALRLGVEEINAQGGLLGRPVQLLVADKPLAAGQLGREAERLIAQEGARVLFACADGPCREAVLPVVERHQHLMFYSHPYAGLEHAPHLFHTGPSPNQQLIPGTHWAIQRFGPRVYLLGSTHRPPSMANTLIRDLIALTKGSVLAERYRPPGNDDFAGIIAELRQLRPDVVLSTLDGASSQHFFQALVQGGLSDQALLSFHVTEQELRTSPAAERLSEHYAAWGYFQSLPEAGNREFVQAFQQRFGPDRVLSDPMVAAYLGLKLWANAVREAGSVQPEHVDRTLLRQSLSGPAGISAVDDLSRRLWRTLYIGKAGAQGQFEIVHHTPKAIRPSALPAYRSPAQWRSLLQGGQFADEAGS